METLLNAKVSKKLSKRTWKSYGFVASIFVYPMILFLIYYVFVNINSIIMAFQHLDSKGIPSFAGIDNFALFFKNLFNKEDILKHCITNSLLLYAVGLIVSLPLSIIFSYYLYKKFLLNTAIRMIVMIPSILSSFVICLLFKKFVEEAIPSLALMLGLNDFPKLLTDPRYSYATAIFYMIWIGFTGNLIIMPNAMNSISDSVIESAELDGANLFRELWSIVLPLIFPILSTFLVTGVAGIFVSTGPLIEFFMYSAPYETWNLGYYLTTNTMLFADGQKSYIMYPYLAATGIIITLVTAPLTFLVKHILDRLDPMEDKAS